MKNTLYLLGAGASTDFGLPLGNEIFEQAYRLPDLLEPGEFRDELVSLLTRVDDYLKQIFTKLPRDKSEYPPFEEVLTFLWDYKKSERMDYDANKLVSVFPDRSGAREVFDIFARLLALTLAGTARIPTGRASLRPLTNFLKSLFCSGDNVGFVSMNYDVLVDFGLLECVNQGVIPDFTYTIPLYDMASRREFRKSPGPMCRQSGIHLLKPHGSLNLVYCPHHQAAYGDGFFYSGVDLIASKNGQLRCPGCGSIPKPLIIPPLYNKADYVAANAARTPHRINFRASPVTYRMHVDSRIRMALAAADEIVIIGYSMPPYDYDFRTLFVSGLMSNEKRRAIKMKLITKASGSHLKELVSQLEMFAGSLEVAATNGFLDFLRTQGFA